MTWRWNHRGRSVTSMGNPQVRRHRPYRTIDRTVTLTKWVDCQLRKIVHHRRLPVLLLFPQLFYSSGRSRFRPCECQPNQTEANALSRWLSVLFSRSHFISRLCSSSAPCTMNKRKCEFCSYELVWFAILCHALVSLLFALFLYDGF